MRIIIINIFGAKYEEKIGQVRLGKGGRADNSHGRRRGLLHDVTRERGGKRNDAKGGMRGAFPPYE